MVYVRTYCRFLALPMAVLMFVVSMPLGVVQAALVSTDQALETREVEADRMRIAAVMARADVQRQLTAQGVDPDEALARIAALSDDEVRRIADRIDAMPAGQDVAGTVLGVLVVVFIILLALDLMGVVDIFPFVEGAQRR